MKVKPADKRSVDDPAIRMLFRQPNSLVATWDIHPSTKKRLEEMFNIPWSDLPFALRLYDVTEREVKDDGLDSYVDYGINHESGEWILFGIERGRTYCVDLGVRMLGGRFYPISRSNPVEVPS